MQDMFLMRPCDQRAFRAQEEEREGGHRPTWICAGEM